MSHACLLFGFNSGAQRQRSDHTLHVLAYNLTRVMNIMGTKPLMAAMRA